MSATMKNGVASQRIENTSVAIVDFETTGLTPGFDRVVEVSVVRIDPGEKPRLVFDTLVNPARPMAATEIHGITDSDVIKAPRFSDIAGELLSVAQGCVIAAYNVYFDLKFLSFELSNAGVAHDPPHLCLMYLRPMLGLGPRCKLEEACRQHGIDHAVSHVASNDALAAGHLFERYLDAIRRRGITTYAELASLKSYKFNQSFRCSPFPGPDAFNLRRCDRVLSRAGFAAPVDPQRQAIAGYWDALKSVLADLEITDEEMAYVMSHRQQGGLQDEQVRVLHARAFASVMAQFSGDCWIDDREMHKLRRLHQCLAKLGWAPGQ